MQANKRNLSEILTVDTQLVAPLFQRPYVWAEEENWEPLWQAVRDAAERRLSGASHRPYFLGTLVLDQLPNAVGTVPVREIVDGQQRMTTLQVLMEVARRALGSAGLEHPSRQLERLVRNDLEAESDERFKVWPTNVDRKAFRAVMLGEAAEGRLAEAATYFGKHVGAWLRLEEDGAKERAAALVGALRQDLTFVAIGLDEDDDGQLIFETLNSLGAPLLPSDLVKNLLFREAMAQGLDTDKLHRDHWEGFEKDAAFWRAPVRIGRGMRPRLDTILQYYLVYRLGVEPTLAHQFREYRDAFKEGRMGTTPKAIADFDRHARLYREFVEAPYGTALGTLRHALDVLDATVPRPLVLGILSNVGPGEGRDAMLRTLESYLVRRMLVGVTAKNLNKVTAELIAKLKDGGWTDEALRGALLAYEGNSTVWPDDGFVRWRLANRSAYFDMRTRAIGFVLGRVEERLRKERSELPFHADKDVEVEHLMPRKWREHWPLPEGDEATVSARREELLHRLGNLTILRSRLNKDVSNGAWSAKREKLNEHTVLLMNSALAAREAWDEAVIVERTAALANACCEIWPRPALPE